MNIVVIIKTPWGKIRFFNSRIILSLPFFALAVLILFNFVFFGKKTIEDFLGSLYLAAFVSAIGLNNFFYKNSHSPLGKAVNRFNSKEFNLLRVLKIIGWIIVGSIYILVLIFLLRAIIT